MKRTGEDSEHNARPEPQRTCAGMDDPNAYDLAAIERLIEDLERKEGEK